MKFNVKSLEDSISELVWNYSRENVNLSWEWCLKNNEELANRIKSDVKKILKKEGIDCSSSSLDLSLKNALISS